MSCLDEWRDVESFLEAAFEGKVRKNGDPMVDHSRRVGRALAAAGYDAVTVFGGYGHDLLEDTDVTREQLHAFALTIFGNEADATAAVQLVEDCSYSEDECKLPKPERKAAACARWIASSDPRVHAVKSFDVDDNEVSAPSVSQVFYETYMAWAGPLRENLRALLGLGTPAPKV